MAWLRRSSVDLRSVAVREFLVDLNRPQGEESQMRWSRPIDTNRYNTQIRITAVIDESRPIAIVASVDECSVYRFGLMFVEEEKVIVLEIFRRRYSLVRLHVREHFTAVLSDERARMQQWRVKNDARAFA